MGFLGPKGNAHGSEGLGAGLLRSAAEDIQSLGYLKTLKPSLHHHHLKLCFQQPFVMREKGSATRGFAQKRLKQLEVPIKVSMEVGSNEAVKQAVAAGLGLGILSRLALKVDEAAGVLKILDIPDLACRRHFYVLHHRNQYLSRPQQAFLDLVKELSQD